MAAVGYRPAIGCADETCFTPRDLKSLTTSVTENRDAERESAIVQELHDISWSYVRQRSQPPSNRSEVSFQLRLIAHLTFDDRISVYLKAQGELAETLANLCPETEMLLCAGLADAKALPSPSGRPIWAEMNPKDLGDAAAAGWMKCRGGDYRDIDLHLAVQRLVELFEWARGVPATYSRLPAEGSEIAGGPLGRFVLDFFDRLDVEIEKTAITGILKKVVRHSARGGKSAQSIPAAM